MNVVRYARAQAFLDAAEPFLLRHEACHNLLLGVPGRLAWQERAGAPPAHVYLAAVSDGPEVVGAAMMTAPYRIVISQTGHPRAVPAFANDAATLPSPPPGVHGPDDIAAAFVETWRGLTGEASRLALHERIHRLDAVRPVPAVPGRLRPAGNGDRPLLRDWLRAFGAEAFGDGDRPPDEVDRVIETRLGTPGEGFALWEDGEPRCVAGFGGATRHGIKVGPVYTPPEHRARGYGTACVSALSRTLLDRGRRFCMLYTDLANPTSNRIYRRIGYEPVCDSAEYRFIR